MQCQQREGYMTVVALLWGGGTLGPDVNGGSPLILDFGVVVQNLAYSKIVGIWSPGLGTGSPAAWSFTPCSYSRPVPGNLEIWEGSGPANGQYSGQAMPFAVEYEVSGNVYWDNNADYNYSLEIDFGGPIEVPITAVIGPNVLACGVVPGMDSLAATQSGFVDSQGNLNVGVLVKNLAYEKQVGIVYTTDNWLTFQNAFGSHTQSFPPPSTPHQPNVELWNLLAPVGVGATGQYAAFYNVGGATYWDNNFGRNYSF
jgi:Carbohydrate/starch-binding module (family 21)